MITNERQFKITRARLRDFQDALLRLNDLPKKREQPWLRKAQQESVLEQIEQLQQQINEYDLLKSGKVKIPDPISIIRQTPLLLIQLRIAKGWDQEELATRLGMAKQQIQRYEQNNYAQATLSVVARVAAVLVGLPEAETIAIDGKPGSKARLPKTLYTAKDQTKSVRETSEKVKGSIKSVINKRKGASNRLK